MATPGSGPRAGNVYVDVAVNGDGMNQDLIDEVEGAGDGIEKAGEEHGDRYSKGFFERVREGLKKGWKEEFEKRGKEAQSGFSKALAGGNFDDLRKKLLPSLDAINERVEELQDRLGRARSPQSIERLTIALSEAKKEATRVTGQLRTLASTEARIGAQIDRVSGNRGRGSSLGDRIGAIFGAGSRNNFFNLFGKTIGATLNGVERLRKAGVSLAGTFMEGFNNAGESATKFQKVLSGLGAIGSSAGARIGAGMAALANPATFVAAVALVTTLSALVSVVGALIGVLTAFASTVVSAVVGSLIVLGGALAAVTAAAGLLTVAFTSMTDAQTKMLSQAFLPVKAALTGVGQLIFKEFTEPLYGSVSAINVWSQNLQKAVSLIAPFSQAIGQGFAQAGANLTAAFSGPGFQMFAQAIGTYLPLIVRQLSSSLGAFLNGLLGTFSALMPFVVQFGGYLRDVAERFQNWATSAQGQNAIVDFTSRALESLKSLWNATKEVFGFISDLLFSPQAMNAGNTIFDGITSKFREFRKAVAEAAADGSLQKWFDEAVKFGSAFWSILESLGGTFIALYNSGVIDLVAKGLEWLARIMNFFNPILTFSVDAIGFFAGGIAKLPGVLSAALGPLGNVVNMVSSLGDALSWVGDKLGLGKGSGSVGFGKGAMNKPSAFDSFMKNFQVPNIGKLISGGMGALNATSKDNGGLAPNWVNPYKDFADGLIKSGPKIAAQIKNAILSINKQIGEALQNAITADTVADAKNAIQTMVTNIRTTAEQQVNNAQSALNSAAQGLSGATTQSAADKALKQVKQAQDDLDAALKNQSRLNKVADQFKAQKYYSAKNVYALLDGFKVQNATLADYIRARELANTRLDKANKKLTDAIALRDDYKSSVIDGVRSFGNLLTAQAQTLNGIEQNLTAGDITTNLQDRLNKIKAFQSNLQILLAQGLSNSAYKQLVDAGVEGGSAYAEALVQGGQGSVQQLNSLVSQIDTVSKNLGVETSNRLYQAGVQAAQGLVDGLTSLSKKLDSAATKLGNSIAASIKKSLGIKSPSQVMIDAMNEVGNGLVIGLDQQQTKVSVASSRLANQIAVNPGDPSQADRANASTGTDDPTGVSGNPTQDIDITIVTPTDDPVAVAHEVLNTVVGVL